MCPVCFSSSSASVVTNYPEGFTDIAAEAAVLGSLILDNDKEFIGPVRAILKDEFYFSKPEHRHLYNAIFALHDNGSGIDCLLVISELDKQQRLKAAGGVDYVVQVAESTPTKVNALFYADKVLEKYKQRLGWDYTQRQQAILRNGGSWNTVDQALLQAAQDHIDNLPVGNDKPGVRSCSEIQTSEIDWLWPNRIPAGMFSLLVGDPGIGKSFLTCHMASAISTGKGWPDGTTAPTGSVFLFCDEDDFGKVVVPRLIANGADISKVFCANRTAGENTLFNISNPQHLQRLEADIKHFGDVRLIVFDPITSYLGKVNANSNAEVREALGGLVRVAQQTGVCMLGISHLNKKSDLDAMYRSLGSMGFVSQARSVWAVVKDKADDTGETRIFSPIKSNLSIKVKGLSYQIENARLVWGTEPIEDTIDQSLTASPALDTAIDFLREILSPAGKEVEQQYIAELAAERQISIKALRRAKKKEGILSIQRTDNSGNHWFWKMPQSNSDNNSI